MRITSSRLALVALGLLMTAPMASAQDSSKSLDGGTARGSVMTRDELRACMKQKSALAERSARYEAERLALAKDKEALVADNEALKGERGEIQQSSAGVAEHNARQAELSARIEDWNQRATQFESENRTGPMAERTRRKLKEEQRELDRENQALQAERAKLGGGSTAAAKDYNARADALQQRAAEWNKRNATIAAISEKLVADREFWGDECGNRRYREDDEKAILKGQ